MRKLKHESLEIGEHVFQVTTESPRLHLWLETAFVQNNYSSDVGRRGGGCSSLSVLIEDGYGRPFEGFDVDRQMVNGLIQFRRADYEILLDDDYQHAKISVYDEFALKHALMNLYSAVIVHDEWGLLIHSCCVLGNTQAYLFSGYSGAGKSTVALLSAPRPVLSNEATIIKIQKGTILAHDSYGFRSDSGVFATGNYPLQAIYLLRQAQHISRSLLTQKEGIIQLMDKVFYWAYSSAETRKVIGLVRALTETVPIYDLYFQKNDKFWGVIE